MDLHEEVVPASEDSAVVSPILLLLFVTKKKGWSVKTLQGTKPSCDRAGTMRWYYFCTRNFKSKTKHFCYMALQLHDCCTAVNLLFVDISVFNVLIIRWFPINFHKFSSHGI